MSQTQLPKTLRPQIETLGFSVENRPISMYWYNQPESAPRMLHTLFIGAFHGDEGIAAQVLFRLINYWENIGTENALPPFGIIPVLNPDGLMAENRVNARGVDLNRNWPTMDWAELNQNTIYYSGQAPASEPETQALMNLLTQTRPQQIISVHSPYKVINYDGPALELANRMSQACGYPVVDDIGYATPGSFGTYCGKERQIPVITLELPPDREGTDADPMLEIETIDTVWPVVYPALLEALNRANQC